MKRILICIALIFTNLAFSQVNLDSLYTVWEDTSKPDSTRVDALYDIIWKETLYSDPEKAFELAENLVNYNKRYPRAQPIGLQFQAIAMNLVGDNNKAIELYQESIVLYKERGNKLGMADANINIGNVYKVMGYHPKALESIQRALRLYEELDDLSGMATSFINIASTYISQRDYDLALEYAQKGLREFEQLDDKRGIATALANVGAIYIEKGNTEKSIEYLSKSLTIAKEFEFHDLVATNLGNLGFSYQDQGKYSQALDYFNQGLKLEEELEDVLGLTVAVYNIALLYQEMGDYRKALEYCNKSYDLSSRADLLNYRRGSCECLYESYKELGNISKALEYHEEMDIVKDSLFNEENTKKLTQLEMQYTFDKKVAVAKAEQDKKDAITEQKIKRQKLVRNGLIGGISVVVLFAGVFFVQRNRIGKEKDRSENLLLNILPAEVAEELKEKGEAEAQDFEMVSILFSDFKGFTGMSEKLSAKDLVANINECFKAFDNTMHKFNIEKIKTIGDAYMAAGGLPVNSETSVKNTVLAALEMQDFIFKLHKEKEAKGEHAFEMRVGIHTGPVVAGIVGVKKFQYDIWGDTVNTASRMESSGEVGKVNISQDTYDYIKDESEFSFESRGKIQAKGKGEVEMYFVMRRLGEA